MKKLVFLKKKTRFFTSETPACSHRQAQVKRRCLARFALKAPLCQHLSQTHSVPWGGGARERVYDLLAHNVYIYVLVVISAHESKTRVYTPTMCACKITQHQRANVLCVWFGPFSAQTVISGLTGFLENNKCHIGGLLWTFKKGCRRRARAAVAYSRRSTNRQYVSTKNCRLQCQMSQKRHRSF